MIPKAEREGKGSQSLSCVKKSYIQPLNLPQFLFEELNNKK